MAGDGAGRSAAKIRGAGGSAGECAAPHSFPRKTPSQHPRQHSRQHPEFSQHSSQHPPQPFFGFPCFSGKKKTNKHKYFRRDSVRDKQEPSLGQMGPLPGTKWDPSLGQTGLSLFNSTVKSPFCPVCPWGGWGFVPGTIVPQGPSEKCLCVFCLLVFFAPKFLYSVAGRPGRNSVARTELHNSKAEKPPTVI